MATKIKRNESNIEKYRDNGNWNKLLDLCKQMTAKDNGKYYHNKHIIFYI